MGDGTAIEWTDATWNPVRGCSRISEGCRNCYAEGVAARFSGPGQPYEGFADRARSGSKWTGKLALLPAMLPLPIRWKRPRRIFVNSMSDLFHENLSEDDIDAVFGVMALAPQHTFQVLTKRADRMRAWAARHDTPSECVAGAYLAYPELATTHPLTMERAVAVGKAGWPLPNVWMGVSVENQAAADSRIPHLLAIQGVKRFLSCEPLLGPVDLAPWWKEAPPGSAYWHPNSLGWVIAGGESGAGARPMHPDWARRLRDQCAAAGVPFHFKQWGEWGPLQDDHRRAVPYALADDGTLYAMADLSYPDGARYGEAVRAGHSSAHLTATYRVGKAAAGRLLDERTHDEVPT